MSTGSLSRRIVIAWELLPLFLVVPLHAAGAAELHMRDSQPAADATIHGLHAEYIVRFDGPVNHIASRMEIVQANHVVAVLRPLVDSAVDVLFASGEVPPPGRYMLRWQAVSPDGTVSTGTIAFSVAP